MSDIKFELYAGAVIAVTFFIFLRQDREFINHLTKLLLCGAIFLFLLGACAASLNDITLAEEFAIQGSIHNGHRSGSTRGALMFFVSACTLKLLDLLRYILRSILGKDGDES